MLIAAFLLLAAAFNKTPESAEEALKSSALLFLVAASLGQMEPATTVTIPGLVTIFPKSTIKSDHPLQRCSQDRNIGQAQHYGGNGKRDQIASRDIVKKPTEP